MNGGPRRLRALRARLGLTTLVLATASCGGDGSTGPANETGSFSFQMSLSALALVQGADETLTFSVARTGGFTGAVTVTFQGLPDGVSLDPDPVVISGSATTASPRLVVGDLVPAGSYTITVRATAPGVQASTTQLQLAVTASGGFALSLAPATLQVFAGSSTTATLSVTRTGTFTGAVTLSVDAPAGITATVAPSVLTGTTAELTVTADASLAEGSYNVSLQGSAAGLPGHEAAVPVTVGPAQGGDVVLHFCSPFSTPPVWVAYQDGDGPWTRVTLSGDAVSFTLTGSRGGIAYVREQHFSSTQYSLTVVYGTRDTFDTPACPIPTPGPKTLQGSVAGVGQDELAVIAIGAAAAAAGPTVGSDFTLQNVSDGAVDLAAFRRELVGDMNPDRVILRRALDPPDGSTLPLLDFQGPEAFEPEQHTLTVENGGGEPLSLSAQFQTGRGTAFALQVTGYDTNATRQIPWIPTDRLESGDVHTLILSALGSGGLPLPTRLVMARYPSGADRSLVLGPAIGPVDIEVAGTSPGVRFRARYTLQPEYRDVLQVGFGQAEGSVHRSVDVAAYRGYFPEQGTVELEVPDLSTVVGWQSAWNLRPISTNWSFIGSTPSGGELDFKMLSATVHGSITP
jgi:hypothetical protein